MSKLHKLIIQFNKLNDEIQNIDSGGCGVFAQLLTQKLRRHRFKPVIRVLSYQPTEIDELIATNDTCPLGTSYSHIFVEVNGEFIDNHGKWTEREMLNEWHGRYLVDSELPLNLLKEWNSDPRCWNDTFDRKNIPVLKDKIKRIRI